MERVCINSGRMNKAGNGSTDCVAAISDQWIGRPPRVATENRNLQEFTLTVFNTIPKSQGRESVSLHGIQLYVYIKHYQTETSLRLLVGD
jgi:hypothetical protein